MPRQKGNIKFISVETIKDLQIVAGDAVVNMFPVHVHEKFCIGVIARGRALLMHKTAGVGLKAGNIYFLNPGEAHQIKPADNRGFSHIVFCFGDEWLHTYLGANEPAGFNFNTVWADDGAISKRCEEFYQLVLTHDEYTDLEYEFLDLMGAILAKYSSIGPDYINHEKSAGSIEDVCSYIKENSHKNLSLNELAALAAMSKYHFGRVFKQTTGISPYDYQIQTRLKTARRMLLNGQPITNVAMELGFTDQSHLHRFFKRFTGLAPAEFINMNIKV